MTKVRTILAEFCSPKEILAINQLRLIKKDERESQPIPWRHRLPNTERRELVLSEMRMSLRPAPRLTSRDKDKAANAARNSIDSKMGECLLNSRIRPDPSLESKLGRINREERRVALTHQQARETFIKKSKTMSHEPLILVERPPSDHTIVADEHHLDNPTPNVPGYMRPLRTRSKTPSMLTTIEAFTMETRKKRNVWEEVLEEKETPRFKSATMPSIRLTVEETDLLTFGHILHKPSAERISGHTSVTRKENGCDLSYVRDFPSVFITQQPEKHLLRTRRVIPLRSMRPPRVSPDRIRFDSKLYNRQAALPVGEERPTSKRNE